MSEQQQRYRTLLIAGIDDATHRLSQNGDEHEEQVFISYLGSQLQRYREARGLSFANVSGISGITENYLKLGELGILDPERFFQLLDQWAKTVKMPLETEEQMFHATYHPHHRF